MSNDLVITFDPQTWGVVQHQLAASALPPPLGPLAGLVPPPLSALPASRVFPDMGWGVVDGSRIDAAQLAKLPGVIVRPARTFRRPKTIVKPAPGLVPGIHGPFGPPLGTLGGLVGLAPAASGGMLFDDTALTWVLKAIGVTATDAEGEGILVGVVDSGVDRTHPDLASVIEAHPSPHTPDVPGDRDHLGHGTHVCGVIAGAATPQHGPRYGIAPRAKLVSYRIYGQTEDATEETVFSAVRAAVQRGCRIIALATGTDGGDDFVASDAQLGEYVESFGAILFAAGGNESARPGVIEPTNAPANAPRIDAIGATDRDGTLWTSSNGSATDLARRIDWLCCGVDVRSALANRGAAATTLTQNASGTSAATAVMAGIAAALWSRDVHQTADDLRAALKLLVTQVAGPPGAVGNGRLRIR